MKTDQMTDPKEDHEANAYKIMDMLGPDEVVPVFSLMVDEKNICFNSIFRMDARV